MGQIVPHDIFAISFYGLLFIINLVLIVYTRCRNIEARFSVSAMFKYMLAVFLAARISFFALLAMQMIVDDDFDWWVYLATWVVSYFAASSYLTTFSIVAASWFEILTSTDPTHGKFARVSNKLFFVINFVVWLFFIGTVVSYLLENPDDREGFHLTKLMLAVVIMHVSLQCLASFIFALFGIRLYLSVSSAFNAQAKYLFSPKTTTTEKASQHTIGSNGYDALTTTTQATAATTNTGKTSDTGTTTTTTTTATVLDSPIVNRQPANSVPMTRSRTAPTIQRTPRSVATKVLTLTLVIMTCYLVRATWVVYTLIKPAALNDDNLFFFLQYFIPELLPICIQLFIYSMRITKQHTLRPQTPTIDPMKIQPSPVSESPQFDSEMPGGQFGQDGEYETRLDGADRRNRPQTPMDTFRSSFDRLPVSRDVTPSLSNPNTPLLHASAFPGPRLNGTHYDRDDEV